ncbi:MAG: phosphate/phosphite/phosphonate ABC transporter substrate-binding protein [Deltaproteobacteria bacterium]|nr:phosphate/phosphite/phosphonate ABC transporter substrate-binding protein [Deltaproteobacteria bacterium]
MRLRSATRLAAPCALCAALACSQSPYPEVEVDMSARPARTESRPERPSRPVLRFSVAAIQSPQDTFAAYSRFFDRMGTLLGAEIRFLQRRTYAEVDDLLLTGQLDAALVCTGGYLDLLARDPGAVEVLAVPVIGGRSTYHSLLIVPATSPATAPADLAGKRFAFTDELSFSGHLYPSSLFRGLGLDPRHHFASTSFTRSHDRSIDAVARGLADGAAVDSLVYESLLARDPQLSSRVRVIHRSPAYGLMPVVAATRLPAETRARLRAVLLGLHRDPEAAAQLRAVGIDRFGPPEPGLFDSAAAVVGQRR